jgi:uncharacterized membrane protein
MPDKLAFHWNIKGQVDNYVSKFWGLFMMPLISVGLLLLFVIIPKIDPLRHNIEKFRKYYDYFIVLLLLFLFYIYALTLVWNMGITFNMTQAISPTFGLLFFYIGILVENAKRNWFIGIRTPWTLSSEKVWNKTHKLGGKLFKIAGIIAFFGILSPTYAIIFVFLPVIAVAIYAVAYSYFEYQKENQH